MTTNATLAKPAKRQIRDFLQSDEFRRQVELAMPKGMRPERFVRIALTATIRNPKLLSCTQESFFKCLLDLSAMGLEPDGKRAHLVPYGAECTLITDYKGIAELVRRNGDVTYLHCDVVGMNDEFQCSYGTEGKLAHIPSISDRGKIWCAYSFVRLKGGSEEWEVMSVAEVERIRKRSKAANAGPWVTDWNEMAKKTVFRRHSKTLPLSPRTREALEYGEDNEADRFRAAVPAKVAAGPHLATDLGAQLEADDLLAAEHKAASESTKPAPADQGQLEVVTPLEVVRAKLSEAGCPTDTFLAVLKRNRMIGPEAQELAMIAPDILQTALDDWETVLAQIKQ